MSRTATTDTVPPRWRRLSNAVARRYHAYANWLVGISWKRFALLALLLLIASELLQSVPPFSWRVTETVPERRLMIDRPASAADGKGRIAITIDDQGVRVAAQPKAAASAASGNAPAVEVQLPAELSAAEREELRQAVQEARDAIQEAMTEVQRQSGSGDSARASKAIAIDLPGRMVQSTRRVRWGDFLDGPGRAVDRRVDHHQDHLQGPHPGRGPGRARHRDGRCRVAEAPGGGSAHGRDAGPGGAAFPVQHAGLDRPPDRDRRATCVADAEEPDRAAARQHAHACAKPSPPRRATWRASWPWCGPIWRS